MSVTTSSNGLLLKDQVLQRIDQAEAQGGIDANTAAHLRTQAKSASPTQLAYASVRTVGADLFVAPGPSPTLGGVGNQIIGDTVQAMTTAFSGIGRNFRARHSIDLGKLQVAVGVHVGNAGEAPLQIHDGRVERAEAFLMPKALEARLAEMAGTPGLDARIYRTPFNGAPYYTILTRPAGAESWHAQVRPEGGELLSAGEARPNASGALTFKWADRGGRDPTRPTKTLEPFSVERYWDADSTPAPLAKLSRVVAKVLPHSGARTPTIEASIALASLMHDVAYYYGGSAAQKSVADTLFGQQIQYFAAKLDGRAGRASQITANVDVDAVALGGGAPFVESYSWSYGLPTAERGYATLEQGEAAKIRKVAQETFTTVVQQIADGTFQASDVLHAKLAQAGHRHAEQLVGEIQRLAKIIAQELSGAERSKVPGFQG